MNNIYDLLNIDNIPLEEKIKMSISQTKKVLKGITTERNCKNYSSYLFGYLNQNHVVSKIIKTNELGASYEHHFVLVPIDGLEYYVIDLTYSQFNSDRFPNLLKNGYDRMGDSEFNIYMSIVSGEANIYLLDDVYSNIIKKR